MVCCSRGAQSIVVRKPFSSTEKKTALQNSLSIRRICPAFPPGRRQSGAKIRQDETRTQSARRNHGPPEGEDGSVGAMESIARGRTQAYAVCAPQIIFAAHIKRQDFPALQTGSRPKRQEGTIHGKEASGRVFCKWTDDGIVSAALGGLPPVFLTSAIEASI